jgi:hypothetical protein
MSFSGVATKGEYSDRVEVYLQSLKDEEELDKIYSDANTKPVKPREIKSTEDEVQESVKTKASVFKMLKKILSNDEALEALTTLEQNGQLELFDRFSDDFMKLVGKQKNLTETVFMGLWERFQQRLLATEGTNIPLGDSGAADARKSDVLQIESSVRSRPADYSSFKTKVGEGIRWLAMTTDKELNQLFREQLEEGLGMVLVKGKVGQQIPVDIYDNDLTLTRPYVHTPDMLITPGETKRNKYGSDRADNIKINTILRAWYEVPFPVVINRVGPKGKFVLPVSDDLEAAVRQAFDLTRVKSDAKTGVSELEEKYGLDVRPDTKSDKAKLQELAKSTKKKKKEKGYQIARPVSGPASPVISRAELMSKILREEALNEYEKNMADFLKIDYEPGQPYEEEYDEKEAVDARQADRRDLPEIGILRTRQPKLTTQPVRTSKEIRKIKELARARAEQNIDRAEAAIRRKAEELEEKEEQLRMLKAQAAAESKAKEEELSRMSARKKELQNIEEIRRRLRPADAAKYSRLFPVGVAPGRTPGRTVGEEKREFEESLSDIAAPRATDREQDIDVRRDEWEGNGYLDYKPFRPVRYGAGTHVGVHHQSSDVLPVFTADRALGGRMGIIYGRGIGEPTCIETPDSIFSNEKDKARQIETRSPKETKSLHLFPEGKKIIRNPANFGKYYVCVNALADGYLRVRYPCGSPLSDLGRHPISSDLKGILYDIIYEKKFCEDDYQILDEDEKKIFDDLLYISKAEKMTDIPFYKHKKYNEQNRNELVKRYKLVSGQILAGNNNPDIIKELKMILINMLDKKIISQRDYNKMLNLIVHV